MYVRMYVSMYVCMYYRLQPYALYFCISIITHHLISYPQNIFVLHFYKTSGLGSCENHNFK